jgi:transcriptional regulator with GAF, ATPase, and Fis domain
VRRPGCSPRLAERQGHGSGTAPPGTFVELADTLTDDIDIIDFLQVLAARCVELLGVGAAGMLLADQDGSLVTVAASDERSRLLELFEAQNDEGPCRDCYRLGAAVVNVDLDDALERWPRFAPQAIAGGFRSANALPLRLRSQTVGSLNLFHHDVGGLGDTELRLAQALADAATIAILQQRTIRRSEVIAGQLQLALTSRIVMSKPRASWLSGCRSAPTTRSRYCAGLPAPVTVCCQNWPAISLAAPRTWPGFCDRGGAGDRGRTR